MKKLIVLLLMLTAFWGCTKRKNPVEPRDTRGTLETGFINSAALDTSIIPQATGRSVYIYKPFDYNDTIGYDMTITPPIPPDTIPDTTYQAYAAAHDTPVLYLLHGYGGNYKYFPVLFDIKNILDEMISSGEIQPMVVILPDADNTFGGSFYADSPVDSANFESFSGLFEAYFVDELMPYISRYFNVDTMTAGRGISGHSMGGYGAYRLAMRHPGLFGSVSAMSAPTAFAGMLSLMPAVFAENGFNPADTLVDGERSDSLIAIRDSIFYTIAPASSKRVTSMMFAMGAAFSPHGLANPDTSLFHRIVRTTGFVGIDLPFRVDGMIDSAFWAEKWLANDVTTILAGGGYAALQGKALYIDCGNADDLGLQYQNRGFDQALAATGLTHIYVEYAGYPNAPGNHTRFVADRLREVLKFHSQAFANR
jgi:S-formylglutathione hydrolase FrmB